MMNKDKILEIAEYLGCNGEELWSELSKLNKLTRRDPKSKQSLIDYLQKDTDERLFQAITNWSGAPYIGWADTPDGKGFHDMWHVEVDARLEARDEQQSS